MIDKYRNYPLHAPAHQFFLDSVLMRTVKIGAYAEGDLGVNLDFVFFGGDTDNVHVDIALNRSQAISLIEVLARIINGAEQ
jgi:hypothetical protein